MDTLSDIAHWDAVHQASAWVHTTILVPSALAQAGCLVALLALTLAAASPMRRVLARRAERLPPGPLHPVAAALVRTAPWLLLLLLLWFARLAFNAAHTPAPVLRLAESLALLWVLIRFSSRLVRNEALARGIAVAAWIIAALNIAGLVTPVLGLLDSMALPLGTFRLSALVVLKGIIVLAVLIWLANVLAGVTEHQLARATLMTPAMRVLIGKLVRLVLLVLAVVLSLGAVGIDLTAFAVFSGAIGVGVGFGLQKVVSNLVSGVILLLDRSIKPGDVIEIDGTYGMVNALNARYAAVTTRDGKEYLIPNEDMITHRVTNWTYSNNLIRLHVKVGVSYDCDLHAAMRLALDAARDVPRVLAEPAPICLLMGFGDSSVELELRFWVGDPANGTANVRSHVMLKLWDLYHANGIKLPFPQREVTLRNPQALGGEAAPAASASRNPPYL